MREYYHIITKAYVGTDQIRYIYDDHNKALTMQQALTNAVLEIVYDFTQNDILPS